MSSTSEYIKNLDPSVYGFQAPGFTWEHYIKYRPIYHESFYERIFDYHASHSSSWAIAHDVGAGAGIASEGLAKKFDHVHVSDPGPEYVEIAEKRLSSLGFPPNKFSFHAEEAEKSSVVSGSVDLLLICEAIHWTDIPVSMKEFARQLKKGGTIAVTFYGPPTLRNLEAAKLWHGVIRDFLTPQLALGGVLERAIQNAGNAFDTVPFDENHFEPGAKRIFVNTGGDLELIAMLPHPGADRTSSTDERIYIEDDEDWIQTADTDFLRGVLASFLIGMKDDEIDKFWPEMEDALGGKEAKFDLIWPNLQLLATRA